MRKKSLGMSSVHLDESPRKSSASAKRSSIASNRSNKSSTRSSRASAGKKQSLGMATVLSPQAGSLPSMHQNNSETQAPSEPADLLQELESKGKDGHPPNAMADQAESSNLENVQSVAELEGSDTDSLGQLTQMDRVSQGLNIFASDARSVGPPRTSQRLMEAFPGGQLTPSSSGGVLPEGHPISSNSDGGPCGNHPNPSSSDSNHSGLCEKHPNPASPDGGLSEDHVHVEV